MSGAKIQLTNVPGELQYDEFDKAAVNGPLAIAEAGFASLASERDAGAALGARRVRALEASEDFRLRVGMDTLLFSDAFPGAALNTSKWQQNLTTMTLTVAGGFANMNAGASAASGAVARLTSYQYFPVFGSVPTFAQVQMLFPFTPIANNVCEWGLFIASGTTAPTDGVFFRIDASGELRGVLNWGGTETQTAVMNFSTLIGALTSREFVIEINQDRVLFWIDDVLAGTIDIPVGQGSATRSTNLPFNFRCYNNAITASAQAPKIGHVEVSIGDLQASMPISHQMAVMGGHVSQGQTGQTLGSTANYANSANPAAAVPTNTTAALGSGLGGQFWETDTLAANTDGIISSYQNPAGTAAAPGRTLMITGVKIATFIQTVLGAGGPHVNQWSLAFGHNAVSLATAEAATTKAPRRIPLGVQAVAATAAAGVALTDIVQRFDPPIPVNPTEFIQTVKKKILGAPASGVEAHVISFDGYWL